MSSTHPDEQESKLRREVEPIHDPKWTRKIVDFMKSESSDIEDADDW